MDKDHSREIIDFWADHGLYYAENARPEDFQNDFIEYILSLEFSSFLEVGSNKGFYSHRILQERGDSIEYHSGFDVSPGAVRLGNEDFGLNLVESSIQDYTSDRNYDLVFSSGVFMYIIPEELPKMLQKYFDMANR